MMGVIKAVNRKRYLDIARGLAILMVVFYHITTNRFITSWFGLFQLYIFFFISGYLFRDCELGEYISRKMKSVVLPYLLWGGITLLYYILIEYRFRDIQITLVEGIIGLFTGQQKLLDFNTPLWFVPCFIVVSLSYFLINKFAVFVSGKLKMNFSYILTGFLIAAIYCVFTMCEIKTELFSIYKVPTFLVAYFIGGGALELTQNYMQKQYEYFPYQ